MILGFQIDVNELFEFKPLFKIGGLGITFPHVLLFAVTLLIIWFFTAAFARPKLVPEGAQNVAEMAVDFVREQIVLPVLGPSGTQWTGFLTAMFYFVLFLNIMSIIPGLQFPVTALGGIPFMLAVLSWVVFNAVGIKEQGFGPYFKGIMFPPGVPKVIYVILTPIELFSTIIVRPITLGLRLLANMMAGHILLAVIFTGTWIFIHGNIFGKIGFVLPFALGTVLTAFEIFVAGMQAFIITILTAVYIAGAAHPEH
ncbi:MAG: F0F1 ATP synthase subunit A [Actinomycetota bacterium]|nr:F0F1 ATP synthase subunit A [Actinomycetota bacterium]